MKIQELLDILLDKKEVPDPKNAPITFHLIDGNNYDDLKVVRIKGWSYCSDINVELERDNSEKSMISEANLKPEAQKEMDKTIKEIND